MSDDTRLDNEDTQKDKYLTFHLAGEDYGIEIKYVIEIIGIQSITDVPDMPAFIRGVINLRGKVIPVMDVRARFELPNRDYDDRTCIIVVNLDGTEVGLVVDEVSEVADIPIANVEPPPKTSKNIKNFLMARQLPFRVFSRKRIPGGRGSKYAYPSRNCVAGIPGSSSKQSCLRWPPSR